MHSSFIRFYVSIDHNIRLSCVLQLPTIALFIIDLLVLDPFFYLSSLIVFIIDLVSYFYFYFPYFAFSSRLYALFLLFATIDASESVSNMSPM